MVWRIACVVALLFGLTLWAVALLDLTDGMMVVPLHFNSHEQLGFGTDPKAYAGTLLMWFWGGLLPAMFGIAGLLTLFKDAEHTLFARQEDTFWLRTFILFSVLAAGLFFVAVALVYLADGYILMRVDAFFSYRLGYATHPFEFLWRVIGLLVLGTSILILAIAMLEHKGTELAYKVLMQCWRWSVIVVLLSLGVLLYFLFLKSLFWDGILLAPRLLRGDVRQVLFDYEPGYFSFLLFACGSLGTAAIWGGWKLCQKHL